MCAVHNSFTLFTDFFPIDLNAVVTLIIVPFEKLASWTVFGVICVSNIMAIHLTVERHSTKKQKCQPYGGTRGNIQRLTKVSSIHPLDTSNSWTKCNGKPSNSCWNISVWTNWLTAWHCHPQSQEKCCWKMYSKRKSLNPLLIEQRNTIYITLYCKTLKISSCKIRS